jgi:hypothetical protein
MINYNEPDNDTVCNFTYCRLLSSRFARDSNFVEGVLSKDTFLTTVIGVWKRLCLSTALNVYESTEWPLGQRPRKL